MTNSPLLFYWDRCVFLSYLSKHPTRIPTLDAFIDDIQNGSIKKKIITSEIAKVEVAFVGDKPLTAADEQLIDDFWLDDTVVELVELHDHIAKLARTLVRESKARGVKTMKPLDAIHLATAISINAFEFHTYDLDHISWYSGDASSRSANRTLHNPTCPIYLMDESNKHRQNGRVAVAVQKV